MTERHQLLAYLATLTAIVLLVGIGAILAYNGKSVEAVGVAAAVTGLIGVIKLPASRSVQIDQPASEPVPTIEASPKEPTP